MLGVWEELCNGQFSGENGDVGEGGRRVCVCVCVWGVCVCVGGKLTLVVATPLQSKGSIVRCISGF